MNLLYQWGGIHLNCSLNGVLLVTLITCSVEWVQPSSLGSNEKILWYLAKRDGAEATSSGDQDSNLLRSNSSNNFSCLCFTVSSGIWCLWTPSDTSVKQVCTGGSGTHVTVTALATGVFSTESEDMPYYSSRLLWHFYCHCTILYKHSVP